MSLVWYTSSIGEGLSRFINSTPGQIGLALGVTATGLALGQATLWTMERINIIKAEQQKQADPLKFQMDCLQYNNPESACTIDGDEGQFFQRISQIVSVVNDNSSVTSETKAYMNGMVRRLATLINEGRLEVGYSAIDGAVSGYTRFKYDLYIPRIIGIGERPFLALPMEDPKEQNARDWGTTLHEIVHLAESEKKPHIGYGDDPIEERKAEFYGELTDAVLRRNGYSYDQEREITNSGVDLPEVIYYLESRGIGPTSNIFHLFSSLRLRHVYTYQISVLQDGVDQYSQGIIDFADNPARVKELTSERSEREQLIERDHQEIARIDKAMQELSFLLTNTDKKIMTDVRNRGLTASDYFSSFVPPQNRFTPHVSPKPARQTAWERHPEAPIAAVGFR